MRPGSHLATLEVTTEIQGSTTSLSISGQVDVASTGALSRVIRDALTEQTETVVLDLSAVEFFSAAGLAALIEADENARAAGTRLVVIPGSGPVKQLLEHTDSHARLTIAA